MSIVGRQWGRDTHAREVLRAVTDRAKLLERRLRRMRWLAVTATAISLVLFGAGWWLGSRQRTLPMLLLESLGGSLEQNAVVDRYLERQALLDSHAQAWMRRIAEHQDEITALQTALDDASRSVVEAERQTRDTRELAQAAGERLAAVPPEQLQPCAVALDTIDAKDLHIAALEDENGTLRNRWQRATALYEVMESERDAWQEAYGKQLDRAEEGLRTVRKLSRPRFRVRPAVFAGFMQSMSEPRRWGPAWGVGLALTYGR